MKFIIPLLAAALWTVPTSDDELSGLATYMNPGKIEAAAARMGRSLDGVAGGVALNRKGDIGRLIWIERAGSYYGPYRVVDCAQSGAHYETREAQRRVVEVSFELAEEWGIVGIGPTPVKVFFTNPTAARPIGAQTPRPIPMEV